MTQKFARGGAARVEVACFTSGTLIATPTGQRPVEALRPGERVLTRDNGIQEIRWVGRREIDWHTLGANPHLKPILVRRGALGPGTPDRDLQLSPNHRLLVTDDALLSPSGEREVLAAARHLVNDRTVLGVEAMGVTYYHLMFDSHQIVLSNGAWSESFQPADFSLRAVGNAQRLEILELFPDLRSPDGIARYGAARTVAGPDTLRRLRD